MKDEIQKFIEKIKLERRERTITCIVSAVVAIFAIGAVFSSLAIRANADEETPHGTLTMVDNFDYSWKADIVASTGRKKSYTINTYFSYTIDGAENFFVNENGGDGNGNYAVTLGTDTTSGELPDDYLGLGYLSHANDSGHNRDLANDFLWKNDIVLEDGTKLSYDHIEIRETPAHSWQKTISPGVTTGQLLCNQSSNPNDPGEASPYGWKMGIGNGVYFWVNDTTEIKVIYKVTMFGKKYHTRPTLGSESGIKINMFDYTGTNNGGGINNRSYGLFPYFTFRNSNIDDGGVTINTQTDADGFFDDDTHGHHATVKSTLDSDGYPVFNCRGVAGCSENSLGYLFGATPDNNDIKNYLNISNTPLQLDENGYYYYDSNRNAVDFDTTSQKFYVRDYLERESEMEKYGVSGRYEFLPFNTYAQATKNTIGGQTVYEYDTKNVNYWYGMMMEFNFFMPKDGKNNGKDMIFSFTGDDDLYVFIDDKLILDLGGTHGPVEGTINFATGEINAQLNWPVAGAVIPPAVSTTLNDLIGIEKYEDFSIHTLKMFYLERGASVANNKFVFNMPVVPNGTVTVQKKLTDGADVTISEDAEYQFTLFDGDANPIPTHPYTLNGLGGENYITDTNGNFLLKKDDIAMFELENGNYRIVETAMPENMRASSCIFNDLACADDSKNDTGIFSITNSTNHKVIITNEPKTFDITVRKEAINANPDEKFLIKVSYGEIEEELTLKNGDSETVRDIPFGSSVTIHEPSHNGYNALIKNTGGEVLSGVDNYTIENLVENRDITVVNVPGVELPETGGVGELVYALSGVGLTLVPCIYVSYSYLRKRKGV